MLVFGALLLSGDRSGDVFGLRRGFLTGVTLFVLSSPTARLAGTAGTLIAARTVQGMGAASLAPTALAPVLTRFSDPRGRGIALGVWRATSRPGGAAGVILSGVYGWRAVSFALILDAITLLAAAWLLMPANLPRAAPSWTSRAR